MVEQQRRTPGAAREAKRRAGIRTDLRAIKSELGVLRREVETLAAGLNPRAKAGEERAECARPVGEYQRSWTADRDQSPRG